MTVRPARERGVTALDWLDSRHSFSFGDYYDPAHMGYRSLRVLNDDRVAAGTGFGLHPHRDMEILTWVLSGELAHRDSMGNGSTIRPGELQRMTAGTGLLHSEVNPSAEEPVHLLQIWLLPERRGLKPGYEQRAFPAEELRGRLRLIASGDGRDGSAVLHQNADVYATRLAAGETVRHEIRPGRSVWVQVALGTVDANRRTLREGDGAIVEDEAAVELTGTSAAEMLVFDLA